MLSEMDYTVVGLGSFHCILKPLLISYMWISSIKTTRHHYANKTYRQAMSAFRCRNDSKPFLQKDCKNTI